MFSSCRTENCPLETLSGECYLYRVEVDSAWHAAAASEMLRSQLRSVDESAANWEVLSCTFTSITACSTIRSVLKL